MMLRRAIAAFVTFAFATLLCAPAFAGVWAVATDDTTAGCCCSKDDEQTQPSAKVVDCTCPACACSVEGDAPIAPTQPIADAPSSIAAIASAAQVPADVTAPLTSQSVGIRAARGPPNAGTTPLYILYESFLI